MTPFRGPDDEEDDGRKCICGRNGNERVQRFGEVVRLGICNFECDERGKRVERRRKRQRGFGLCPGGNEQHREQENREPDGIVKQRQQQEFGAQADRCAEDYGQ